jgi:hypothetical protein
MTCFRLLDYCATRFRAVRPRACKEDALRPRIAVPRSCICDLAVSVLRRPPGRYSPMLLFPALEAIPKKFKADKREFSAA